MKIVLICSNITLMFRFHRKDNQNSFQVLYFGNFLCLFLILNYTFISVKRGNWVMVKGKKKGKLGEV